MSINYIDGDATSPVGDGNKIIVHVCNDIGAWGKGFVLALSRKWKKPEQEYRRWHKEVGGKFVLGSVQFVQVESNTWVANLIGQHLVHAQNGIVPVRYDAISNGLKAVAAKARELQASIHMPRIGCSLAGGRWSVVEPIIIAEFPNTAVTVYTFGPYNK